MLGGVVLPVVHAHHDRDVLALGGGADDDLLGTGLEMLLGLFALGEQAGGFDDDFRAELLPRQVGRVALGQDLDAVAVDHQALAVDLDMAVEPAQHRVVLQQVGQGLGLGDVVHRYEVELRSPLPGRAEEVPTDPSEAVDADLDRHLVLLRVAAPRGAGAPGSTNPSTRPRDPSSNALAWSVLVEVAVVDDYRLALLPEVAG